MIERGDEYHIDHPRRKNIGMGDGKPRPLKPFSHFGES